VIPVLLLLEYRVHQHDRRKREREPTHKQLDTSHVCVRSSAIRQAAAGHSCKNINPSSDLDAVMHHSMMQISIESHNYRK